MTKICERLSCLKIYLLKHNNPFLHLCFFRSSVAAYHNPASRAFSFLPCRPPVKTPLITAIKPRPSFNSLCVSLPNLDDSVDKEEKTASFHYFSSERSRFAT